MSKIVFVLVTVFIISGVSAQKAGIGIIAGPVLTSTTRSDRAVNNSGTSNDRTITFKSLVSFKAGIVASIPISNFIVFRPELTYIGKGFTSTHSESATDYDTKLTSDWIELPLDFVYNIPTKNGRFFLGLGPYLSCAFSSTLHNAGDTANVKTTFSKPPSGPPSKSTIYANRFDIGANILAGYEFRNHIVIGLNYSRGFSDFRNDFTSNTSNKNIVVGLSIGYMFK